MKKFNWLLILGVLLVFTACNNDDDIPSNQINSFIYRGLNRYYLFKDQSPDLADNRFSNNSSRINFINSGGTPEAFFERLTVSQDRFSFILNDFEILERLFEGTSTSNGLQFNEKKLTSSDERYIVITDVVKGSPADIANIKRGMIFNRVNGSKLTVNNRSSLFRSNSVTIGEAILEEGELVDVANEILLTRVELTENPVAKTNIIEDGIHKIGYLQYNSFTANFEKDLNAAFLNFKSADLTDFVLDLRYNPGGRVSTATALAGMLTGQFTGKLFSKRQWNAQIQVEIENRNPESLLNNFVSKLDNGEDLNSLNLKKLYVITTKDKTASSSELVINSLKPYIDVIVIGDPSGTQGKSQASITLYDSRTFDKENRNTNHKYVMQPLVLNTVNVDNQSIPNSGIQPDIEVIEDDSNLGILGDPNEPLLKAAIDDITGRNTTSAKKINSNFSEIIGNESMYKPTYQRMYETPTFFQ